MTAFAARAATDAPTPAPIVPYVYGATLGAPSRGRPEKVLARLKTIAEIHRREERAEDAGGRSAAAGRARRRLEFLAAEASGAGIIAAAEAERLAALELELAGRGVVAIDPARRCKSCGCLTTSQAHRDACEEDDR